MDKLTRIKTLFSVFFGISSVAVGGGLTMLPAMTREFVEKRNWMTDNDMVDTVAVMQSLPGIISINMAVLIGYRVAGIWGALSATMGVVTPPFLVILVIAMFMKTLDSSETLTHIFLGVRASVAALILLSAIKLGRQIVKGWFSAIVATAGFIALIFFETSAILLVIAAALIGILSLPTIHLVKQREASR